MIRPSEVQLTREMKQIVEMCVHNFEAKTREELAVIVARSVLAKQYNENWRRFEESKNDL